MLRAHPVVLAVPVVPVVLLHRFDPEDPEDLEDLLRLFRPEDPVAPEAPRDLVVLPDPSNSNTADTSSYCCSRSCRNRYNTYS